MRPVTGAVLGLVGVVTLLALAPPAVAVDDDRVAANATLTSGETYCEGQEAFFGAPASSANATYRAVKEGVDAVGGTPTREVPLDGNATAVVPTNDLMGNYSLRNESGDRVVVGESGYQTGTGNASEARWQVLDCTFAAEFAQGRVLVDDEGGRAALGVDASDDAAVYVGSDRLTDATLADLTGGTVTANGTRVPVEDGRIVFEFPATFACRTGEYAFTVEGASTGAETTVRIPVETSLEATPSLDSTEVTVSRGGTAAIGLSTRCEREVTLRIGNESFRANATLSTTRRNDYVELRFDTGRAGSASGTELFSGASGGSLASATVERRPESDALPVGEYDLTVYGEEGRTDVGVLRVRSAATATPTDTPTATPTTARGSVATPTPTPVPTDTPTPVPTVSPTSTPTASPPATATASASATATDTRGPPDTGTGGQPGFGAATGVLALLAAALLARRRA